MCKMIISVLLLAASSLSFAQQDTAEIRITFTKNPDLSASECNPLVTYDMDSDLDTLSIQTTFEMEGQRQVRSVSLKRTEGALRGTATLSGFAPQEAKCSDVAIELIEIKCANPNTLRLLACGIHIVVDGESIFSSFHSRLEQTSASASK